MISPGPSSPLVRVDNLRMHYRNTDVLRGVTFSVLRGETVALLGPNGAGKTTTVEVLEGFRRRSAGEVCVLGADPADADERWRARVGVVLQSWRDHGRWRAREFLAYQATYYTPYSGTTGRAWNVDELLAAVGLVDSATTRIDRLSGGQRRRLDLAAGLVGRPELLFLDEPTSGLDPQARREFHDLLGEAVDTGTTVLLTTHDLDEAARLADRIVVLVRGRVIADGTPADLAARITGQDKVSWALDGHRHRASTPDSTSFARDLLGRYGDRLTELEIGRASLEDTYLALVRDTGTDDLDDAARAGRASTSRTAP